MTAFIGSRRQHLKGFALFGAGLAVTELIAPSKAFALDAAAIEDADILQFALNLEYFETEFYLRAMTGNGIDAADAGENPGAVTGGRKVPFQTRSIQEFGEEIAENELAHVRFYRQALGGSAVARPTIDLEGGFAAVAQATGLPDFDPFADETNFLLAGMLIEDAGVTAYTAAIPLLKKQEFVEVAASILAVEAYHMGMARSQLYQMGERAQMAANAISSARDAIDGPDSKDQGILVNGKANFVPSDENGMAFRRTPQEVLRIVYLTEQSGMSSGGFFPSGLNGRIKST